jgi:hypothetical protein
MALEQNKEDVNQVDEEEEYQLTQTTRRTAFGIFFLGFAASPAATQTISTPPYEKAALTSVDQRPVNRPVLPVPTYSFIAPSFQYLDGVSFERSIRAMLATRILT